MDNVGQTILPVLPSEFARIIAELNVDRTICVFDKV